MTQDKVMKIIILDVTQSSFWRLLKMLKCKFPLLPEWKHLSLRAGVTTICCALMSSMCVTVAWWLGTRGKSIHLTCGWVLTRIFTLGSAEQAHDPRIERRQETLASWIICGLCITDFSCFGATSTLSHRRSEAYSWALRQGPFRQIDAKNLMDLMDAFDFTSPIAQAFTRARACVWKEAWLKTYSWAQWWAYFHPWWAPWWTYLSSPAQSHGIWAALWNPDCPGKSHWTPKWGVPLSPDDAFQTLLLGEEKFFLFITELRCATNFPKFPKMGFPAPLSFLLPLWIAWLSFFLSSPQLLVPANSGLMTPAGNFWTFYNFKHSRTAQFFQFFINKK